MDDSKGHKCLSLQESQEHMSRWTACHKELCDAFPDAEKLEKSLTEFKTCLFSAMQQGFLAKEVSLKAELIELVGKCLTAKPDDAVWVQLQATIEDYQRLGTAEVFPEEIRRNISQLGEATSILWKLGYHCISLSCSQCNVSFKFQQGKHKFK